MIHQLNLLQPRLLFLAVILCLSPFLGWSQDCTTPSIPTISGNTSICSGSTTVLTSSAATGNLWSNGATTQSITVNSPGAYTVQTISGACTSSSSEPIEIVTSLPTPIIESGGPTDFCEGNPGASLYCNGNYERFIWSNGESSNIIYPSTSGSYTVRGIIGSCTSDASNPIQINVNPTPVTPEIEVVGGTPYFCSEGEGTRVLRVTNNNLDNTAIVWSNGQTGASCVVSRATGQIQLITAYAVNGTCTSATSSYITIEDLLEPRRVPIITVENARVSNNFGVTIGYFCEGSQVTLTSSYMNGNLWSNGATTQSITVSTPGEYTVRSTLFPNCTFVSSTTVLATEDNVPPAPTISASGETSFCEGGSVTLTANFANSYLWSTGETSQSINVTNSGTYTLRDNIAICPSMPSNAIVVNVSTMPSVPTISASGSTTICSGNTVTLTSSSITGNLWSNGATTQSIIVSSAGTYSVRAINGTCTSAVSSGTVVSVTPLPTIPTITPMGSTTICSGNSVTLTSNNLTGNLWSNGATSQSIIVSEAGSYFVRYISNGCTSLASAGVEVSVTPLPNTPTISGNTSFCAGNSTLLTSSSTTGNIWSNGATTQSITINQGGNYSVRAIANGCTSATSNAFAVNMIDLPTTPTITSSNGNSICANESTILSGGTAVGYIWSNGATTQTITVGVGNYWVRTLNAAGCTSLVSGEIEISQQNCNQVFTGTGNLSNNSNWSTGSMPTFNTDAIIDGVLTVSSNYSLRNISVNAGDTVKIPSGVTLTITGNLSNEGAITGLGTVVMAGPNNKSLGGGSISNLTVANSQTVNLSAGTTITGTLTLGANTIFDLNNNRLTLESNALNTARLAPVPSSASLIAASNFTVQRWLNPNNTRAASNARGNYYYTGPVVQNQTVGLWNGVSPYGAETFNQVTQSGSRFYFHNATLNAWRKPTSLSQALPAGTGVQVWFGTSAFFGGGRTTWSASGIPVVGNFNMPITSGVTGFNLLSNPYPSTIDWDSPSWTKTGVANALYIYDWKNQRYRTYVNGIGTNGGTRYLPTAQGFFVNATSSSAVLTATENIKVSNQVAMQRTESNVNGLIRLAINNNGVTDEMVIANRNSATIAFEADQDAQKMMNPTTNIFVSGAVNQSIASMNLSEVNSIPFVLQTNRTGEVSLGTTELSGLEGYTLNLFNEQTGELLPYTGTETYTFSVTANQPYRLQLRVGSVTGINTFKASNFEVFPNPATDKVTIHTSGTGTLELLNVVGQVVISQPATETNEIIVSKLAKGVYTVKFNGNSQKLVVK